MTYEKLLLTTIHKQTAVIKAFMVEYDYSLRHEDREITDPPHVAQARELLK